MIVKEEVTLKSCPAHMIKDRTRKPSLRRDELPDRQRAMCSYFQFIAANNCDNFNPG